MSRYVEVKFTKEFVSGPLKGTTFKDKMKVPTKKQQQWIRNFQVMKDTGTKVTVPDGSDFIIIAVES